MSTFRIMFPVIFSKKYSIKNWNSETELFFIYTKNKYLSCRACVNKMFEAVMR